VTVFETSLLSKSDNKLQGFTPFFADRTFWGDTLISQKYINNPTTPFYLVTSTGDRLVDSAANPFIALT
jgi:hypothetical protein